jgi:hypothetical protein
MAVLVSVEVPRQTPEGFDGMLKGLEPLIRELHSCVLPSQPTAVQQGT